MKTTFYPANERGYNNLGWLDAKHSFSFGHYYDPNKVQFGLLRVLNDDTVAPGMGFGTHPHDNMEIVTIPLSGAIVHKDSIGNSKVIETGEIQIMSAGTGVSHSEMNYSSDVPLKLLQIWVFPKERDIEPRYDQLKIADIVKPNVFTQVVSPLAKPNEALWINQDAYFSMGNFEIGQEVNYQIMEEANGAYIFVIEGEIEVNGKQLKERDAIGIYDTESIQISIKKPSKVLIIDVPMY